ncbi:DUF3016 domain-containing protein [Paracoccus ravus]|uniref:DUF3016 domain-containing protein n=1 Tax=Paracoccus ravus TaxID=2447760 RepID=UPI003CC84EFF
MAPLQSGRQTCRFFQLRQRDRDSLRRGGSRRYGHGSSPWGCVCAVTAIAVPWRSNWTGASSVWARAICGPISTGWQDVRILRDVIPPWLHFRYTLLQNGRALQRGEARLSDLDYLSEPRARAIARG